MTAHVIDFDPAQVTILTSAKGRPMAKAWHKDALGQWQGTAYNQSAWFVVSGSYRVATLGDMLGLLQYAEAHPTSMVIRGQLRTDVEPGHVDFIQQLPVTSRVVDGKVRSNDVPFCVATMGAESLTVALRRLTAFVDVPRLYGMIDVDGLNWSEVGLDGPDYSARGAEKVWRHIVRNLPNAENIGCVYQWSSSAGIKPGARIHFYVVADEPRDGEWWANLYQTTGQPRETAAGAVLCRNGNGSFDFDPAPFRTVQPNYVTNPTFEGCSDPIEVRHGIIPGDDFPTRDIESSMMRPAPATFGAIDGDAQVVLHNTATGERKASTARGSLWGEWQDLRDKLSNPVNVRLGTRRIEPVLEQLRTAPKGALNDVRFEATKGLRKTLALELMGVEGLLDALCAAMCENPAATRTAAFYRPEFERALTYAFKGYEPAPIQQGVNHLTLNPVREISARYLPADTYDLPSRVVAVRSPMGTGKSVSMNTYIKREGFATLRAVAPRRSLVRAMASDWSIQHYTDDGTDEAHLATTLHSLYKTPAKPGQVLVIDEVEQAVEALLCEIDRPATALAALREHFRVASKVILADAHLGWQAALLLELVGLDLSEVTLVNNGWRKDKRSVVVYESDEDSYNTACTTALEDLCKLMKQDKGLAYLACTSKGEAERVSLYFADKRPQARQLVITSDTTHEPHVQAWFADPDGESSKYDIIVASPSVQSGVSLTVRCSVAVMFGRMGAWTSPNKAVQQFGRARNAVKRWWVLDTSAQTGETSVDAIINGWNAARHATFGEIPVRGADGVWSSIPQHTELMLATARYEARKNMELMLHTERVRELLCEHEGYELEPRVIVLTKDEKKAQVAARRELREAQESLRLEEAARIHATPCPSEYELGVLLSKQELTRDEQRAATHGLAARMLGEAPTLADIERTQTNRNWYRESALLGALYVADEDFNLLRLQELERVIDGHTSSLKLHNTATAEAHFARELVRASGLGFMFARDTKPEDRVYNPSEHWTPERVAQVEAVMQRHGKSYSQNVQVHSIVHRLFRSLFGFSLDREQPRNEDGERITLYRASDAMVQDAHRWTQGTAKSVESAHTRLRNTVTPQDTLRVIDPDVSMAVEPIPAAELQPLTERFASELGQRAALNKIFDKQGD